MVIILLIKKITVIMIMMKKNGNFDGVDNQKNDD